MSEQQHSDATLAVLAHRVEELHSDFTEIRLVLKELSGAIHKLVLVEERQAQFAAAQDRSFNILERLEDRVAKLEGVLPVARQTHAWVTRAALALAAAACIFVATKVGLLG